MRWKINAPPFVKSGHKIIHTKLNNEKALAERYEKMEVSHGRSLFICPCEKCNKKYIRAPSARKKTKSLPPTAKPCFHAI